ncbi:hypothetical protein CVT24_006028 [Panaeolus cyanescens]|uniref:Uncharacterized protein n=1 Tax=Panaeolus cyanescens TaxID=181874 RepID=A0A409YE50_9AGAR|nr:hypothetical protein CVT24_006028 [Panaeolus cyanescens]
MSRPILAVKAIDLQEEASNSCLTSQSFQDQTLLAHVELWIEGPNYAVLAVRAEMHPPIPATCIPRSVLVTLSEEFIQDSFHSYLKSSLSQAKGERLLDADVLASAESDLMITGPALCLYFAALRCTTNPPSVPLPRNTKSGARNQPTDLSFENCPAPFISFLKVWANTVPKIQGLVPEAQHDLARVICGLEPLMPNAPSTPLVHGIAAALRAVAIEISQRRSFQDRYASDLQAALDAGGAPSPRKASFVPPPVYVPSPSTSRSPSPNPSTRSSIESNAPPLPARSSYEKPPRSPGMLSPSSSSTSYLAVPPSPTSSILNHDAPAIEFIRETLYAALGDVLAQHPLLRRLLKQDPARAYFGSVALAILDVSTRCITADGAVIGVRGKRLTASECPPQLLPFMKELVGIGHAAKSMEEEDNEDAIKAIQTGQDVPEQTRLERVKLVLEGGIGYEFDELSRVNTERQRRRSVEGRAVAFANRVNALSLGMTRLRAFRERQDQVFKVLAGVSS